MKKLTLFILLLILPMFISPVFAVVDTKDGITIDSDSDMDGFTAEIDTYDGQTVDPSAACATTLITEDEVSGGTPKFVGKEAASKYWATKFVATSTTTACKVDLYLSKTGSPTFDLKVWIYSHDGGGDEPNAVVGTGSGVISSSTLTGSEAIYSFVNISASITDTTAYWIVLEAVTIGDDSNYIRWYWEATGTTERLEFSTDASTWTNNSTSVTFKYVLYGT